MYTFTCQFEVKCTNVLFWPVWPSINVHTCWCMRTCRHIHNYNWLNIGGVGIHGNAAESSRRWAEPRWLMGDVVRRRSRHIQMCVEYSLHSKTTRSFKAESDCKDTRAPCDVWCYQKWPSNTWAELWFGEGRLPSAGWLVELQTRKKRSGQVGKERW